MGRLSAARQGIRDGPGNKDPAAGPILQGPIKSIRCIGRRTMTKAGLYAQGILAIGVAVASLGALPAAAQDDYPSRPIRMIVPFGAGGGIDFTARAMSGKIGRAHV